MNDKGRQNLIERAGDASAREENHARTRPGLRINGHLGFGGSVDFNFDSIRVQDRLKLCWRASCFLVITGSRALFYLLLTVRRGRRVEIWIEIALIGNNQFCFLRSHLLVIRWRWGIELRKVVALRVDSHFLILRQRLIYSALGACHVCLSHAMSLGYTLVCSVVPLSFEINILLHLYLCIHPLQIHY